jgi:hypothetical protein
MQQYAAKSVTPISPVGGNQTPTADQSFCPDTSITG